MGERTKFAVSILVSAVPLLVAVACGSSGSSGSSVSSGSKVGRANTPGSLPLKPGGEPGAPEFGRR